MYHWREYTICEQTLIGYHSESPHNEKRKKVFSMWQEPSDSFLRRIWNLYPMYEKHCSSKCFMQQKTIITRKNRMHVTFHHQYVRTLCGKTQKKNNAMCAKFRWEPNYVFLNGVFRQTQRSNTEMLKLTILYYMWAYDSPEVLVHNETFEHGSIIVSFNTCFQ